MGEESPAGWYVDPKDAARGRYWDGERWTESTTPIPPGGSLPVLPGSMLSPEGAQPGSPPFGGGPHGAPNPTNPGPGSSAGPLFAPGGTGGGPFRPGAGGGAPDPSGASPAGSSTLSGAPPQGGGNLFASPPPAASPTGAPPPPAAKRGKEPKPPKPAKAPKVKAAKPASPAGAPNPNRRAMIMAGAGLGLIAVVGLVAFLLTRGGDEEAVPADQATSLPVNTAPASPPSTAPEVTELSMPPSTDAPVETAPETTAVPATPIDACRAAFQRAMSQGERTAPLMVCTRADFTQVSFEEYQAGTPGFDPSFLGAFQLSEICDAARASGVTPLPACDGVPPAGQ